MLAHPLPLQGCSLDCQSFFLPSWRGLQCFSCVFEIGKEVGFILNHHCHYLRLKISNFCDFFNA